MNLGPCQREDEDNDDGDDNTDHDCDDDDDESNLGHLCIDQHCTMCFGDSFGTRRKRLDRWAWVTVYCSYCVYTRFADTLVTAIIGRHGF